MQATVPPSSVHQRRPSMPRRAAAAAAVTATATGSVARTEVNIAVLRGRDNLLAGCLPCCLHSVAVPSEFQALCVEFLDY